MMSNGNGDTPNDYQYDVFLSYSFKEDVRDWVAEKFYPNFVRLLDTEFVELSLLYPDLIESGRYRPPQDAAEDAKKRIYDAKVMTQAGDVWSDELQGALRRSRVLVAICSPHYFASRYCRSEWRNFKERGPNLIIPVIYYGSNELIIPRVEGIQYDDFREFIEIYGDAVGRFRNRLRTLAKAVAAKAFAAPAYRDDFPARLYPGDYAKVPLMTFADANP